jgi:hypothetical protein
MPERVAAAEVVVVSASADAGGGNTIARSLGAEVIVQL